MRKAIIFFTAILFTMLATACQSEEELSRPLTTEEIQQFIVDTQINPVAIREEGNATLILFNNEASEGFYSVTIDANNEPVIERVSSPKTVVSEISVFARRAGEPLVAVIIQDDALAQEAESIEVVFQDGQQETRPLNEQEGLFLFSEAAASDWQRIILYAPSGEEIYTATAEE